MGKFAPKKQHGDCEEIANPSTAYGRRRRNWIDAHGFRAARFFGRFFLMISDYFCRQSSVRRDVADDQLTSSSAKHCMLLIRKAVENQINRFPLPAPKLS
jgi:hypothetical protein